MRVKNWKKMVVSICLIAILVVSGTTIYAEYVEENKATEEPVILEKATIVIPEDIEKIILDESEQGLEIYKDFLVEQNVHSTYQALIQDLLTEGHELNDIMIGYTYIADHYGKADRLLWMLEKRKKGESWKTIFTTYTSEVEPFVPTDFDQVYLQKILSTDFATTDEIMIADQIAQSAGVKFTEVLYKESDEFQVKIVCEKLGLLGSKKEIPHVSISMEELKNNIEKGYKEETVINAYVVAIKVNKTPNEILSRMSQGVTEEAFMAEYLIDKYTY